MTPPPHTVLVEVFDRYRESGEPVAAETIAESLNVPEERLSSVFESLREFELLVRTDGGYRPTVTAEELLALDIELDDVVVLDLVEE